MKPFFPILINSLTKKKNSETEKQQKNVYEDVPEGREILEQVMLTQLKMTRVYNDCAACCDSQSFRSDMLNILKDNYDIYNTEYDEAKKRGWLNETAANDDEVETLKAKFN